jgi:hypothetical protein
MDTKFNFYDFVGYVIPGAVVIAILCWFYADFLTLPLSIGITLPDAAWFLLFLAAGYFFGHIVQAAGASWQGKKEKKEGWLSEKYLQDGNSHYTAEYKIKLKDAIEQTFGLQLNMSIPPNETEEQKREREDKQKRRQQEIFYLCQALIPADMRSNADNFRAACALYRGLWATARLGTLVSLTIVAKQVVVFLAQIAHINLPKGAFFTGDLILLFLGFVFAGFFFFSSKLWLNPRWHHYTEYYVDAVYTAFYARCKEKSQPNVKPEGDQQPASVPVSTLNGDSSAVAQ